MDRENHTDAAHRQPPALSAIGADTGPQDPARQAIGGPPGSRPAHFISGREGRRMGGGDRDNPGEKPDEIVPNKPDTDRPGRTPDEVQPGQGDFDRPDSAPAESPPHPGTAPAETPPPD
jgi:hypothetical protein